MKYIKINKYFLNVWMINEKCNLFNQDSSYFTVRYIYKVYA